MSDHSLKSGKTLVHRYEIVEYLASGGMQEVYVAKDKTLKRQVVLKTPKPGVKDKRFARGAEMGARVNHPNVAATFDYFEDNGVTCLVEEFIKGKDLGKRLADEFFYMDPALAAHTIHHVGRAIHEAHRAGIFHRDLKPGNIMTSADNEFSVIKLTDFGIAKLAENELGVEIERFNKDDSTLTTSQTLLGAAPYMAPECFADWKNAGPAIDVWALGCIAYHLLDGNPPFGTGRNAIVKIVLSEHKGVNLSKPSCFGSHTSTAALEKELWNLITLCLKPNPQHRPSAKEVVEACDRMCYATSRRQRGIIDDFPGRYSSGAKGNFGFIADLQGENHFFHGTDFFGAEGPKSGQHVSFSEYPGVPKPRVCPVLLMRS